MPSDVHAETRRRGEDWLDIDSITAEVVDACIAIHRDLGPGLLEGVYELVLAGELERRGLHVERQKPVDIHYQGIEHKAAFRMDLLIQDTLILGIKSVDALNNAHLKQLLTYLRLTNRHVGLLLNFSGATMKEGIRRIVNDHQQPQRSSASPRLRVKNINGEE